MMVGVRIEGLLDPTQAIGMAQLGEDQRQHVDSQLLKRLVVGVALVPLHNRLKPRRSIGLSKPTKMLSR